MQRRVALQPRRVTVDERDVAIDVAFEPSDEFEVYRPEGQGYLWSHKQFAMRTTAQVRLEARTLRPEGALFVDINAGYHPRQTRWRWSAGAGLDQHGRRVAWNAITGLFDTREHSERTIWIDGVASEIGPVRFSDDLRTVSFSEGGTITFRACARRGDEYTAPFVGGAPFRALRRRRQLVIRLPREDSFPSGRPTYVRDDIQIPRITPTLNPCLEKFAVWGGHRDRAALTEARGADQARGTTLLNA